MTSTRRIIIGAVLLAVIVAVLLVVGPAACNKIRSQGAQIRLNEGQTGALSNSAADAVKTQGEANKREADSEALSRSNEKDIRDAEGANDPVATGVRDAGLRSLCKRAVYRDSERCRMFKPPAP